MKMTGAQIVLTCLKENDTSTIFGYPGAAISPIYDKLTDFTADITHILARGEQSAAHMASGYARTSGKAGICMATSGPGATNMLTAIATAYMDSIAMIAITGQVERELIGKDAFQETDFTGATLPFCKHSYLIKNVNDIIKTINDAFHIATTGRKGPVVIDLPIDVLMEETDVCEADFRPNVDIRGYKPSFKGNGLQIKKVLGAIYNSKRPVILAGGGIVSAAACQQFSELAKNLSLPVVSTMMGLSAASQTKEFGLYYGLTGVYGTKGANYAMENADLIIAMGTRLSDRTIENPNTLIDRVKLVHIDIDPAEIGKNVPAFIPVVGDIKEIIGQIKSQAEFNLIRNLSQWKDDITAHMGTSEVANTTKKFVDPTIFMAKLSAHLGENTIIATEVGQHQVWCANGVDFSKISGFLCSGGLGTMGYGLPAAIGAKVADSNKTLCVVVGDGSFQMSMAELATMRQFDINIKIIMINNGGLGLVRELQKSKFDGNTSNVDLCPYPNFIKLMDAYGYRGIRIEDNIQIDDGINQLFDDDKTMMLEVIVDPDLDCIL